MVQITRQQFFGMIFIISGIIYLSQTIVLQNDSTKFKECEQFIDWSYGLSIWLILAGLYLMVQQENYKILKKVYMGHLLNLKEMLGVLLLLSSLCLVVGLSFTVEDSCGIISVLIRLFIYVYWGITALIYFMLCIFVYQIAVGPSQGYLSINNV